MYRLRRYFLTGLLVLIPLVVTILIISFLLHLIDQSFLLLPQRYRPDNLLGVHIPGFGLILAIIIVLLTGAFAANFIGRHLVALWENILHRIPLVRSIYGGVKQVTQTLFSSSGESFRKVLLVEYPRRGLWSIAFQTGNGFKLANESVGEDLVTIFIPTTPNPTSGFLMMVPKRDTIELTMGVDAALKMVISLGVVIPDKAAEHLIKESQKNA